MKLIGMSLKSRLVIIVKSEEEKKKQNFSLNSKLNQKVLFINKNLILILVRILGNSPSPIWAPFDSNNFSTRNIIVWDNEI